MIDDEPLALTVSEGHVAADLVVTRSVPLRRLLPELLQLLRGVSPAPAAPAASVASAAWEIWEGRRRLPVGTLSLQELGVVSGSTLRLLTLDGD